LLLLDEPFGALDPGIRRDMHDLLLGLWEETGMTVFMVTHDIAEAFKLGTRLIVFDKVRHEPDDPDAAGATITYDLPLRRPNAAADDLASASVLAANALDASISVLSKETSTESGEKH
jgi:NitT/TauT family transport system ATP-binding protein